MPAIEPLWAPDTTTREAKAAGWKRVGEMEDGRPIWEAEFEEKVGEVHVEIAGKPQWVMVGTEPVKPRMKAVMAMVKRQFVEEKQPNGGKFMNFNFQPDPEEKARIARKEKVRSFMERFAEAAVDRGIDDPEAALAMMAGEVEGEEKPRRGRRA